MGVPGVDAGPEHHPGLAAWGVTCSPLHGPALYPMVGATPIPGALSSVSRAVHGAPEQGEIMAE